MVSFGHTVTKGRKQNLKVGSMRTENGQPIRMF